MDLPIAKLIKLAKKAGVMHEADHAYSIRSTWWLHRIATDVPFIAGVINLPCTFNHHLDMSSLQFCFMIWIVVFFNFNHLSPVGLFCECCRMSLLWLTESIQAFCTNEYVKKLDYLGSVQRNENLNPVIASKSLKVRYYGDSESNDFRAAAGVAQFNESHSFFGISIWDFRPYNMCRFAWSLCRKKEC